MTRWFRPRSACSFTPGIGRTPLEGCLFPWVRADRASSEWFKYVQFCVAIIWMVAWNPAAKAALATIVAYTVRLFRAGWVQ